jgi:hypothetical protein
MNCAYNLILLIFKAFFVEFIYKKGEISMEIKVIPAGEDDWCRKLFKNAENGRMYVEVDGWYYTMTSEGEPECPLKRELKVIIVEV